MTPETKWFMDRVTAADVRTYAHVGANDGKWGDRLFATCRRGGWDVLLVEPRAEFIPELRANYAGHRGRVVIEQVAIAEQDDGIADFYHYPLAVERNPEAPPFTRGVGSLRQELVERRPKIRPFGDPVCVRVRTRTLDSLLRQHEMTPPDLLAVDIEGCDDVAVLQALSVGRPAVLMYEHYWLPPVVRSALLDKLTTLGYTTRVDDQDVYGAL